MSKRLKKYFTFAFLASIMGACLMLHFSYNTVRKHLAYYTICSFKHFVHMSIPYFIKCLSRQYSSTLLISQATCMLANKS